MAHAHATYHSGKNLRLAFFLNLGFTLLEFFGGLYTNSVAILSDALHDLGDSLSLGLAWCLDGKAKHGATEQFTYGYRRFSLLGALINGLVLVAGSVVIVTEAIRRIQSPEPADARGMVLFALIGIAVNGYAAWKVHRGKSINEKMVSWHLLEDVLGWVAVLMVAIVLLFQDIQWLDPALSLAITLFILFNVLKRLRDTVFVFLQGKPTGVDLETIKNRILNLDRVGSLHHTHLWTLDGEHHVFSTHIKLKDISRFEEIIDVKKQIKDLLRDYNFSHYTIETELEEEWCDLA